MSKKSKNQPMPIEERWATDILPEQPGPFTVQKVFDIFRNAGFKVSQDGDAIIVGLNRHIDMVEAQRVVWDNPNWTSLVFSRYGREVEITLVK